jgi:transcriptional regulator with XRE-family HTH domain
MPAPKRQTADYIPPAGWRLEAWRKERGWSKAELCKELGLSQHPLDAYESGARPCPKYIALAYAALAHRLPPIA